MTSVQYHQERKNLRTGSQLYSLWLDRRKEIHNELRNECCCLYRNLMISLHLEFCYKLMHIFPP